MGIPAYFSWLIRNHPKIIEILENIDFVDNLYLDSNSIIYDSIDFDQYENCEQFENYLIQSVLKKIEIIIALINPKKRLIIAFDGVPPIAKLNQQKNRRYKSWFQAFTLNNKVLWDSCAITPGTLFMEKLNCGITEYFAEKQSAYNIILSLTDKPGEGEHKIFEYIRTVDHVADNTIIYGMDADLIMLSLNHLKYCKSIYLFRETPVFINSLDSTLNPNEKYLINILELGSQIFKELTSIEITDISDAPTWLTEAEEILENTFDNVDICGNNTYATTYTSKSDIYYSKIDDYIFICFLLGNDFMPHFPAINIRMNGFTVLFELYKSLFGINKQLICNGKIVWTNFKTYIGKLAENEHNFIVENFNIKMKQSKKYFPESTQAEKEHKFVNIPTWEKNIENFINPLEPDWEFRYYYSLFGVNIDKDPSIISRICANYLQTLQWTYYYYSKECVNWSHYYKYSYPPLLIDLYKHIPYFNSELVLGENKHVLNPKLLLSYVLPKNSLYLLPKNIHNYLLKNYENNFREDYEFEYAFCKYFWEGHVKFPKLDFDKFSTDILKLI